MFGVSVTSQLPPNNSVLFDRVLFLHVEWMFLFAFCCVALFHRFSIVCSIGFQWIVALFIGVEGA